MKIHFVLISLVFLFACKAGKVPAENATHYLQLSLAAKVKPSSITTEYGSHGVNQLRPTSRSQPLFITSLECSSTELADLIKLMEADKRIMSVKEIEKKEAKNLNSTNSGFGKSKPKN